MIEILKAAREKISDPEHWCQRYPAKTADDKNCSFNDSNASKWCMSGAIWCVVQDQEARCAVADYIESIIPELPEVQEYNAKIDEEYYQIGGIFGVNDRLGHQAVMRLFDLAISRLEETQ